MNSLKQALWLCMALISLAGSGWYFATSSAKLVIKMDDNALSTMKNATITDLYVHQFNSEGRLVHYLHTPQMTHIPFNDTHELLAPEIIVIEENQSPWSIQAKKAVSLHGGQKITLSDNVIIHKDKNEKTQETTLKTEEITYFPQKKIAKTKKEVLFTQAGNQVQSTGMKADLTKNRVQLLQNARGIYESGHG